MTKTQAMLTLQRKINAMPFAAREDAMKSDPEILSLMAVLKADRPTAEQIVGRYGS